MRNMEVHIFELCTCIFQKFKIFHLQPKSNHKSYKTLLQECNDMYFVTILSRYNEFSIFSIFIVNAHFQISTFKNS